MMQLRGRKDSTKNDKVLAKYILTRTDTQIHTDTNTHRLSVFLLL